MRDIKFRAWRWVYEKDQNDKRKNVKKWFMTKSFTIFDYSYDQDTEYGEYDLPNQEGFLKDSCILMQYTALKDKNGTEVYEGDIVGFRREDREVVNHFVVRFGNCEGGGTDESFSTVGFYYESFGGSLMYGLNDYSMKDYEVIGNIYENPDLLESSQDGIQSPIQTEASSEEDKSSQ